jgi:GNAT superfamily N-acetyltransferase
MSYFVGDEPQTVLDVPPRAQVSVHHTQGVSTRQPECRLELMTDEDPFALHRSLWDIWPEPYRKEAAWASHIFSSSREIFYVVRGGEVVGITGVFFDEEGDPADGFLRWTGIIPGLRKTGLGRLAIEQLARLCQQRYPECRRLVELVPDNEYGHTVPKQFFEKLGFVPCPAKVPVGEDADWPVIAYAADLMQLVRG